MHLTEDSTKLKLFMDVLDGTKAAVSHNIKKRSSLLYFEFGSNVAPHLFSADHTHIHGLFSAGIHDGYSPAYPPEAVEKVCNV